MDETPAPRRDEPSTIATLQSLIVAFVLAMTFRGFVTEGFVIPTGSMAPTLMGEHFLMHSGQTGSTYPVDSKRAGVGEDVYDPMLGKDQPLEGLDIRELRPRMGDRILVLKCLYPFAAPERFDVVVFKNPTDPDGEAENYIKRLIGLPDEAIWLVDGDVFAAPAGESDDLEAYEVQRKPEYVQRGVWQPVHNSDFVPRNPQELSAPYSAPWRGDQWVTDGRRIYRTDTAEPTTLSWDDSQIELVDWTPYNMFSMGRSVRKRDDENISDLRVAAAIVPDQAGLTTRLEIETRGHVFRFAIARGTATMSIVSVAHPGEPTVERSAAVPQPEAGRVYRVEFWHVDQAMYTFVNGKRVGEPLRYNWTPVERVESAYDLPFDVWAQRSPALKPAEATMRWHFAGSPVTLHRVRVDRDLYYRADILTQQARSNPTPPGYEDLVRPRSKAFGTHPDKPAVLGPDQFFMLGDNSPASSDSRLWGNAHPYVVLQIDDSPFVVNRKLLLGKAWVVYFPAPYPLTSTGRGWIPDFGRLRFIR